MWLEICDCSVWCNRHRVCFMLKLGLHSCSVMNWISGLRFSIPYLTGGPGRLSLLFFPFQVRPTSKSDYIGPVLLCFYYYRALDFYHSYHFISFGPLGIWASIYRLCYFVFRTFGLSRTLYFGCYHCWAFRPYGIVLTFILWYGDYYYYFCLYLFIIRRVSALRTKYCFIVLKYDF